MLRKRLVLSICSVLFSIGAAVTGTFAWFSANGAVSATGMSVAIANPDFCKLVEFNLLKFEYPEINMGSNIVKRDYLNPSGGHVEKYSYNDETNEFGQYNAEGTFVAEESALKMNLYDPLEVIISNSTLLSMNTNVIYEAKIQFSDFSNVDLVVNSLRRNLNDSKILKATDCLEFDVFFENDLNDSRLVTSGIKNYYPSYISQTSTMTSEQSTYFKFSYLSSLKAENEHKNFFGSTANSISLFSGNKNLDENGIITVYVNVNYSVEKLEKYSETIRNGNITVTRDFNLSFDKGAANG